MNITGFVSHRWFKLGALGIVLALLIALPYYASGYTPILMTSIFMYVVLTVSWTLFSGPTGYMSLATAAFFGIGIYTAAILGKSLPLPVFVIAGGLISSILAVLIGALTLRLKGVYFAIFTFGLVMLIPQILVFWELHFRGTRGEWVVVMSYHTIYYTMLVILSVLLSVAYLLRRSRFGLALQSIGEYEEAASHVGINVVMIKVLTFALSAFFIAAAGATMATRWTYIDPYIAFNANYSFLPVLMALFGGIRQLYGTVIGAVIFAYLQEKLITRFPEVYMLIFGIVLLTAILYMPDGLAGLINKLRKRTTGGRRAIT